MGDYEWIKLESKVFKEMKIQSRDTKLVYFLGEILSPLKKLNDTDLAERIMKLIIKEIKDD